MVLFHKKWFGLSLAIVFWLITLVSAGAETAPELPLTKTFSKVTSVPFIKTEIPLTAQTRKEPILAFDPSWNRGKTSAFVKRQEGFELPVQIGSAQRIRFPEVLDSKSPIVIETRHGPVKQYLASHETYKAELQGRYLIYRGKKNSILYRYDTQRRALREFVYLAQASDLPENGRVIEWRFEGADLKARDDGSLALTKTVDFKAEVRKISNDPMAERISRFLAQQRGGPPLKDGPVTHTLFVIPSPEYIDGHRATHTSGVHYTVQGHSLILALQKTASLNFPLWVDPTLRADAGANVIFDGQSAADRLGRSVASAGDFNGDGFGDVIVGGVSAKVYIFFGQNPTSHLPSLADDRADVIINGPGDMGDSVASAGDFNGDGFDDVIVGTISSGAYILFGRNPASQLTFSVQTDADVILNGQFIGDQFGRSVASAGDFNGDGFDDVIVGAIVTGGNTGSAYIFFGRNPVGQLVLNAGPDADVIIDGQSPGDLFGTSVASAGDFNGDGFGDVIVGAQSDDNNGQSSSGSAFIFFGQNPVGQLVFQADTDANVILDGQSTGDLLGTSVASAGDFNGDGRDDVIVGAYADDNNGENGSGSAFIFFGRNPASQLVLRADAGADVILDGQSAGDRFAFSVASAGDFNGDGFDDVIVGAWLDANNGLFQAGSAFIFFGQSPASQLVLRADADADLILDGQGFSDFFGWTVASAGDFNGDGRDDVIVGAWQDDNNLQMDSGSAFIFRGAIQADTDSNVVLDGQSAGDQFGWTVASAGDFNSDGLGDVIVGAWQDDNNGESGSGSAFIFFGRNPASQLALRADAGADVILDGQSAGDRFAFSVAGAGDFNNDGFDDVIVGASQDDNNGETTSGSAFIFFGRNPVGQLVLRADADANVILDGQSNGDFFANSVASAGDFNGDGFDDVIAGAHGDDNNGEPWSGSAFIFFGRNPVGQLVLRADADANVILEGQSTFDFLGLPVASAGDFNGDGLGDVIVGAQTDDNNGETDSGSAFIFFGRNPVGQLVLRADADANVILDGQSAGDRLGIFVSSAGDFNGDGFDDVIAGASVDDNNGETDSGSAFIFFGRLAPIQVSLRADADANVILDGQIAGDRFGFSTNSLGDFNGDGFDDVIVGANGNDQYGQSSGRAFLFYGRDPAGQLVFRAHVDADFIFDGQNANDVFGNSVASAGDFNGDGLNDVIVGANGDSNNGEATSGSAFIFFSPFILPRALNDFDSSKQSDLLAYNTNSGEIGQAFIENAAIQSGHSPGAVNPASGWIIHATGDFNGDRKADFLFLNTLTDEVAIVLMDGATVLSSTILLDLTGSGFSLGGTGDFDGDGKTDAIAFNSTTGETGAIIINDTVAVVFTPITTLDPAGDETLIDNGDFNGDSFEDLLLFNSVTREISVVLWDGAVATSGIITTLGADQIVAQTADFNGDNKFDLLTLNTTTGDTSMIALNGTAVLSETPASPIDLVGNWSLVNAGNYNGGKSADYLLINTITGDVRIVVLDNGAFVSQHDLFTLDLPAGWTLLSGKP